MNFKKIIKADWFNKIIGRGKGIKKSTMYDDTSQEFEYLQEEISRMFNHFYILTPYSTKEMVSEYRIPKYDDLQQDGLIVYGYTLTVGSNGRPQITEFGNVKSFVDEEMGKEKTNRVISLGENWTELTSTTSKISAEREPVVDVTSTDKEVKVVLEILGVREEDIAINAYDDKLEILTNGSQRNYHKLIELPQDADTETARFTYNNGVLEVTLKKKNNVKSKGKEIKVE